MDFDKGWICDACGEIIENPKDGWVEWIVYEDASGERKGRDLRLVHHKPSSPRQSEHGCQFDEKHEFQTDRGTIHDLSLTHYLGADGLTQLLALIAEKRLPTDEVLEMIKRLHVPGYEHARNHFAEAIAEGVFEPNTMTGYYWQSDIKAVLKFIGKKKD